MLNMSSVTENIYFFLEVKWLYSFNAWGKESKAQTCVVTTGKHTLSPTVIKEQRAF